VAGDLLHPMWQYTRRCRWLNKGRAHLVRQMDNQLQRCNIRFSNYVFNQENNVSLRKFIMAIIGGERDPDKLCSLVHGCTLNKYGRDVIQASLDGVIQ
jgi:hypothetical protein